MADVFISYKRSERARVQRIASALEGAGYSVWFDARLEVGGSDGFDAEIEREVSRAKAVLVCWTPEAVASIYVRAEAKKGLGRSVLVPVLLTPCTLPVPFNDVDTVDLSHWNGDVEDISWQRVCDRLLRLKNPEDYAARIRHANAEWHSVKSPLYPGNLSYIFSRMEPFKAQWGIELSNKVDDAEAALMFCRAYLKAALEHTASVYRSTSTSMQIQDMKDDLNSDLFPRVQGLLDLAKDISSYLASLSAK